MFRFLYKASYLVVVLAALLPRTRLVAQDFVRFPEGSVLSTTDQLPNRYSKIAKLSPAEQWKVEAYGLRMAPLDPQVWAIRKVDLTENRRLVPMRKFYLLQSEQSDFRLQSITMQFRFRPVKERHILMLWHSKDPIFDVGFAGRYDAGALGRPPLNDTEYFLRLSAFPGFPSGLYFRNGIHHRLLVEGAAPKLVPGRQYNLDAHFTSNGLNVLLDGEPFLEYKGAEMDSGLISLCSSWHPIYLPELSIKGSGENGVPAQYSGLISKKGEG